MIDLFKSLLMSNDPVNLLLEADQETNVVSYALPIMETLKGVEIKNGIVHKDNYSHSLEVLGNLIELCPNAPYLLRLSALLHDIGKPVTKRFVNNKWTFYGHEVEGYNLIPQAVSRLGLDTIEVEYIQKLTLLHLRAAALMTNVTDSAVRRLMTDAGNDLMDLMLLSRADVTSKNPEKVKRLDQQYKLIYDKYNHIKEVDEVRLFDNPVDGYWIMNNYNLNEKSEIGEIKEHIRIEIISGRLDRNDRSAVENCVRVYCANNNIKSKLVD